LKTNSVDWFLLTSKSSLIFNKSELSHF